MLSNFEMKYYKVSDDKIIFYPRANLKLFTNIAFSILSGAFVIGLFCIISNGFSSEYLPFIFYYIILPLLIIALPLHYWRNQKIVIDKHKQEIISSTLFGRKKHIADLSEVSYIQRDDRLEIRRQTILYCQSVLNGKGSRLTSHIKIKRNDNLEKLTILHNDSYITKAACYTYHFKSALGAQELKLTPYMKVGESGNFEALTYYAICNFINLLSDNEENIPSYERITDNLRLFQPIADGVYSYTYTSEGVSFLVYMLTLIVLFFAFLTESYSLFVLLVIPTLIFFKKSKVIINKNAKAISIDEQDSEKISCFYTDISYFDVRSLNQHNSGKGIHSVDIRANMPDGRPKTVAMNMKYDWRPLRLMEEIQMLVIEQ